MKFRTLLLAFLSCHWLNCKNQEVSKPPVTSQPLLPKPAKPTFMDIQNLRSIRFIQLMKSEENHAYFTQDDCRCTQFTASFSASGELSFSVCDSVDSDSRYPIDREVEDTNGISLYSTQNRHTDTIQIRLKQADPAIYEINRSNFFDVESGNLFINAKDSSQFEHREWDCDEYQG